MDYLESNCIWCDNDVYTMFFEHEDIKKVVIKRFCSVQCEQEYHNTVLNPIDRKEVTDVIAKLTELMIPFLNEDTPPKKEEE